MCYSHNTTTLGQNTDFTTDIYKCNDCGFIQNDFVSNIYLKNYYAKKYREIRKETITDKYLEFMTFRAKSQKDFILKNIDKNKKLNNILDIGAGSGKLIEQFISNNVNTFAVESDEVMIKYISNNTNVNIIDFDNLFIQENYEKFDLIMMSHVFEHINNPIEYLYKLHKIIKKDGYLFIEVPNETEELVLHHIRNKKRGIGHLFNYTIDALEKLLLKSGLFEIVNFASFGIDVNEYIKGGALKEFSLNSSGNGVYLRFLLKTKKNTFKNEQLEYRYIDTILENRYFVQLDLEKTVKELNNTIKELKEKNSYHYSQMVEYKEKATRQHKSIEELNNTIKELKEKNSYHYSQMVEYKEKATRQHKSIKE
jgi:2-polyprenyl-3-methyl-5-hydroxy-6-metoxy-1,4-benzoquinol methylase